MTHRHTIHQNHLGWDNSLQPAMRIAPGTSLEFEVADASGGQISPESTAADVGRMDFAQVNPVSGPIFIEGAEPGDVLKVTLLSFAPSGWGWTANIPGFGLLPEDFKEAAATQIPVRRVGQPDDVANTISFLVSEGAGFVSGQVIYVAGGPLC